TWNNFAVKSGLSSTAAAPDGATKWPHAVHKELLCDGGRPLFSAHDDSGADSKLTAAVSNADRSVHVTTFSVLFAISTCHLLNDMMQSLLAAIYPQLKISLQLNFVQVGLISATYQFTASMLQPLVGLY